MLKLIAGEPNQVGPVLARRGPKHGSPRFQLLGDCRPVDLVQGRAVVAHGNDVLVPRRKRVGDRIGEARAEITPALLRTVNLDRGQPTVRHRPSGMVVKRRGHPSALGVVLPHELFVQPLPFRAAAEEQNGGVCVRGADGNSSRGPDLVQERKGPMLAVGDSPLSM